MAIALVTAAGVGSRMKLEIPKQFLQVHDKPIVVYTLEVLQRNSNIDAIIVACLPGWEKEMAGYVETYGLTKVKWIVKGGHTGQQSILNCLAELEGEIGDDEVIMVHDGNRPLLDDYVINESVRVSLEHGGAVAVVPTVEAVLRIDNGEAEPLVSTESIDRDTVMRTQTPHSFPFRELYDSYLEIARNGNETAVAPCTVMVDLGKKVYLSPGSDLNMKITTQADLEIFTALLHLKRGSDAQ